MICETRNGSETGTITLFAKKIRPVSTDPTTKKY